MDKILDQTSLVLYHREVLQFQLMSTNFQLIVLMNTALRICQLVTANNYLLIPLIQYYRALTDNSIGTFPAERTGRAVPLHHETTVHRVVFCKV